MKKKDIVLSEKDQIKKPDYRIPYDEILKIYGINSRKGKNYDIKTYIRRAFIDTYPDKKSWDELLDLEQKKFTYIAIKDKMLNFYVEKYIYDIAKKKQIREKIERAIENLNSKYRNYAISQEYMDAETYIRYEKLAKEQLCSKDDTPEQKEEAYKKFVAIWKFFYKGKAPSKEEYFKNPMSVYDYACSLQLENEKKLPQNEKKQPETEPEIDSYSETELKLKEINDELWSLASECSILQRFKDDKIRELENTSDSLADKEQLHKMEKEIEQWQKRIDDIQENMPKLHDRKVDALDAWIEEQSALFKLIIKVFNIVLEEEFHIKIDIEKITKSNYFKHNVLDNLSDYIGLSKDEKKNLLKKKKEYNRYEENPSLFIQRELDINNYYENIAKKISPLLSVDKDGTTIKLKSEKKTFKPIKRILDDK